MADPTWSASSVVNKDILSITVPIKEDPKRDPMIDLKDPNKAVRRSVPMLNVTGVVKLVTWRVSVPMKT